MKHIAIFDNTEDVQTALNEEVLVKPYVALVSGALDYNTMEPEEPAPTTMGIWSGKSFQVTETGTTYWEQPVKIGVLNDVYLDGNQDSPDVMLSYSSMDDEWHMEFASQIASNPVDHNFSENEYHWESGAMTDPNESISAINVDFDGTDTFTFDIADGFLTTINPEYPEVSGE